MIVTTSRSPDALLDTICDYFTRAPDECDEELSVQSPSPGFGEVA